MMQELSDMQLLLLDMLMRARSMGVHSVSRTELLFGNERIPASLRAKLVMTALLMDKRYVTWVTNNDFSITEQGVALYKFAVGQAAEGTPVADSVICLPDLSTKLNA